MRGGARRRVWAAGVWAVIALAAGAETAQGQAQTQSVDELQRRIRESAARLDEIRSERTRLEGELQQNRARAADASTELRNVEQRLSASRSVLAELDLQRTSLAERVDLTTTELLDTRDRLLLGRATLNRRLREIHKLGPLRQARVLLSSTSFTEFLVRYRYLGVIAAHDRALVDRVAELESDLAARDAALRDDLDALSQVRGSRENEVARLAAVERERQNALARFRAGERQAMGRLEQLAADEARLSDLVSDLERLRVEAERALAAAGGTAGPSTLAESDAGSLAWPVEGELLYRFGLERRPNGTVLRWNGIGIAAEAGSPVRAVRGGTVVLAGPFEGYGPTVVVSHGSGFYTLYLYLREIAVTQGRTVQAGEVLGTVGGEDTPEGSHLEFQLRAPSGGGAPSARDPLEWLRPRQGRR